MRRIGAALALLVGCLAVPATAAAVGEPVNTAPPTVTQSGTTLTATTGTWIGVTRPFAYQWLRCADTLAANCEAIPGQTQSSYTLTDLDAGSQVRVQVTGSNPAGSTSVVSAPVAVPALPVNPSPARPTPLSPFPVISVTGRVRGARTRITGLVARGQAGATVSYRCVGRCRPAATTTRIARGKRVRLRSAERLYRAGQAIEIRITARNRLGKFTRIRLRNGRTPSRLDRCLAPGSAKPIACG